MYNGEMTESSQPTTIQVNGSEKSFGAIHGTFSESEWGESLGRSPRYEKYKPGFITASQWQSLLGVDVQNLKHLRLTYGLARQFLRHLDDEMSDSDRRQLLFAAVTHDWAESVVGDITYDAKDDEFVLREVQAYKDLIRVIIGEDVQEEFVQKSLDIIFNKDSELGRVFNAIEKIGYLRIGLRAWSLDDELTESSIRTSWVSGLSEFELDDLRLSLRWLSNNVLLNQIPTLCEYADRYEPVRQYLDAQRDLITEAFEQMPAESFDRYERIEERLEQFGAAHAAWSNYLAGV